GMIAFLDPQDVVQTVGMEGGDRWGIGTQTVFGDNALEVRVILAQLGYEALSGMPFTIIFPHAIVLQNRFGHQRNHGTHVWMDNRGAQHLVTVRNRPVAVDLLET